MPCRRPAASLCPPRRHAGRPSRTWPCRSPWQTWASAPPCRTSPSPRPCRTWPSLSPCSCCGASPSAWQLLLLRPCDGSSIATHWKREMGHGHGESTSRYSPWLHASLWTETRALCRSISCLSQGSFLPFPAWLLACGETRGLSRSIPCPSRPFARLGPTSPPSCCETRGPRRLTSWPLRASSRPRPASRPALWGTCRLRPRPPTPPPPRGSPPAAATPPQQRPPAAPPDRRRAPARGRGTPAARREGAWRARRRRRPARGPRRARRRCGPRSRRGARPWTAGPPPRGSLHSHSPACSHRLPCCETSQAGHAPWWTWPSCRLRPCTKLGSCAGSRQSEMCGAHRLPRPSWQSPRAPGARRRRRCHLWFRGHGGAARFRPRGGACTRAGHASWRCSYGERRTAPHPHGGFSARHEACGRPGT
mmetsp:Transcript_13276/g.27593  ORF Transcript_13276/g.27593 Transcript_13276/m.27593 type:complete len:421 (-) Transcript_13276:73-1335(-)